MIKFREQVPSVYTDTSRDFQYLGWLINIVFNAVKHNVDGIYNIPNADSSTEPEIAELLALTLGFNVKRNYNQAQLAALVNVIPSLLRYKGTRRAVDIAGNALIKASGSSGKFTSNTEGGLLEVTLPKDLIDITLFIDLLPYILPAGMSCKIARKTQLEQTVEKLELLVADHIKYDWFEDIDSLDNSKKGLSSLYDVDDQSNEPRFGSFKLYDPDHINSEANTGLLDNSIIPVLSYSDLVIVDDSDDYEIEANESGDTVIINNNELEEDGEGNNTVIIGD